MLTRAPLGRPSHLATQTDTLLLMGIAKEPLVINLVPCRNRGHKAPELAHHQQGKCQGMQRHPLHQAMALSHMEMNFHG